MNIYTIILMVIGALIIIWRVVSAYKRGFVNELCNTIAIIIAIIVGRILLDTYRAFVADKIGMVLTNVALVAVVFLIYKILKLIMSALRLFASLPVIIILDKLIGIVVGLIEGFVIIIFLLMLLKSWL